MPTHKILLTLDGGLVARLDHAVLNSQGVYTNRSQVLRHLIHRNFPEAPAFKRLFPAPAPLPPSIDDALARAEAELRGDPGWETGTDGAEVS